MSWDSDLFLNRGPIGASTRPLTIKDDTGKSTKILEKWKWRERGAFVSTNYSTGLNWYHLN